MMITPGMILAIMATAAIYYGFSNTIAGIRALRRGDKKGAKESLLPGVLILLALALVAFAILRAAMQ